MTQFMALDDYGDSLLNHGFMNVGSSVIGAIDYEYDHDWFNIDLVSGTTYAFTLIGDTLDDPELFLLDDNGKLIESNDDHRGYFYLEGLNGLDSQIIYHADRSGTFFLQARELNSGTGTYDLSAISISDYWDSDRDGFIDDVTNYQMYSGTSVVDLSYRGRTFSDQSSRQWDAVKAVVVPDGFEVLLEGAGRRNGQYRVADANESGEVGGASRWMSSNQMASNGYEEIFAIDFNGNGVVDFF